MTQEKKLEAFYSSCSERAITLHTEFLKISVSARKWFLADEQNLKDTQKIKDRIDVIFGAKCFAEIFLFFFVSSFGLGLAYSSMFSNRFATGESYPWVFSLSFISQICWWMFPLDSSTTALISAGYSIFWTVSCLYFGITDGIVAWSTIFWSMIAGGVSLLRYVDATSGRVHIYERHSTYCECRNKHEYLAVTCKKHAAEAAEYVEQLKLIPMCFATDPSLSTLDVVRAWEKKLYNLEGQLRELRSQM